MTVSKFALTQEDLRAFIEEPYLSRGEQYFQEGRVEVLSVTAQKVKGRALGTSVYRVQLERIKNEITGHCTCPAFQEIGPCKHLAAVGFAVLQKDKMGYQPSGQFYEEVAIYDRVESSLQKRTKEELVELVMEVIADDHDWLYELDEDAS